MSDAIARATVVREVALALGRFHQDEAAYLAPQARAVTDHLYEKGLIAPAPLREVTTEQVEDAARFAYKTDWAAQRTARMPFSDKYTGDQYRSRARAMFCAAGFVVQDAVNRAEGDGRADASEPTVRASQLRAFARLCVDGGDMTPAAARMLDRIIEGDGKADGHE